MSVFGAYADRYRKIWVTVMGVTATLALCFGAWGVANSDLFTVRVVEVQDLGGAPADDPNAVRKLTPLVAQQILEIAKVPTESTNLFS